jgi:hypothetical protein
MRSLQICLLLLLTLCAEFPNEAFQGSRSDSASDGGVEAIYMVRSMRESRVTPTKFCEQTKTGFSSTIEEQYTFRSTATRPTDGLMINTNVNTVGSLHACSGRASDPTTFNFYAEGVLGKAPFTGAGDCRILKQGFPEPGISAFRCFLELRDLPTGYVGGLLTTNTVLSRNLIGENSDPPGYTQPSVAIVRLWKRR